VRREEDTECSIDVTMAAQRVRVWITWGPFAPDAPLSQRPIEEVTVGPLQWGGREVIVWAEDEGESALEPWPDGEDCEEEIPAEFLRELAGARP
jgi:hypothetical protein